MTKQSPIPLSVSPLKGEIYNFTLPFKGRAGVGMGLVDDLMTLNHVQPIMRPLIIANHKP
jgi:hypothetical protein